MLKLLALVVVLAASGAVGAGIYSAIDDVEEVFDERNEPLRRFQAGEATALVKKWLGSRPYNFSSIEGDCLYFHELESAGHFIEQDLGNNSWGVTHEMLTLGDYTWIVYEESLAINSLLKPEKAPC